MVNNIVKFIETAKNKIDNMREYSGVQTNYMLNVKDFNIYLGLDYTLLKLLSDTIITILVSMGLSNTLGKELGKDKPKVYSCQDESGQPIAVTTDDDILWKQRIRLYIFWCYGVAFNWFRKTQSNGMEFYLFNKYYPNVKVLPMCEYLLRVLNCNKTSFKIPGWGSIRINYIPDVSGLNEFCDSHSQARPETTILTSLSYNDPSIMGVGAQIEKLVPGIKLVLPKLLEFGDLHTDISDCIRFGSDRSKDNIFIIEHKATMKNYVKGLFFRAWCPEILNTGNNIFSGNAFGDQTINFLPFTCYTNVSGYQISPYFMSALIEFATGMSVDFITNYTANSNYDPGSTATNTPPSGDGPITGEPVLGSHPISVDEFSEISQEISEIESSNVEQKKITNTAIVSIPTDKVKIVEQTVQDFNSKPGGNVSIKITGKTGKAGKLVKAVITGVGKTLDAANKVANVVNALKGKGINVSVIQTVGVNQMTQVK